MKNSLSPSLLTWLRCFDAVSRNGSFTIAANELHVTQGSISQQVKKLEEYLGVTLLQGRGPWPVAGFDLTMLTLGAALWWAQRRLARRASAPRLPTPQSGRDQTLTRTVEENA